MIQLVVSILLYFVIFFGISFILNMLLRKTWLMTYLYPVIIFVMVGKSPLSSYFISPINTVKATWHDFTGINFVDVIILTTGLVGTIVSGFVIRYLRKHGYQMF